MNEITDGMIDRAYGSEPPCEERYEHCALGECGARENIEDMAECDHCGQWFCDYGPKDGKTRCYARHLAKCQEEDDTPPAAKLLKQIWEDNR